MLARVLQSSEEDISAENLKLSFAILGLCLMNQGNSEQNEALKEVVPLLQVTIIKTLSLTF